MRGAGVRAGRVVTHEASCRFHRRFVQSQRWEEFGKHVRPRRFWLSIRQRILPKSHVQLRSSAR